MWNSVSPDAELMEHMHGLAANGVGRSADPTKGSAARALDASQVVYVGSSGAWCSGSRTAKSWMWT